MWSAWSFLKFYLVTRDRYGGDAGGVQEPTLEGGKTPEDLDGAAAAQALQ